MLTGVFISAGLLSAAVGLSAGDTERRNIRLCPLPTGDALVCCFCRDSRDSQPHDARRGWPEESLITNA